MFKKCDWTKYLKNIPKRNYQSNNACVVTFVLIFSFHRVIIFSFLYSHKKYHSLETCARLLFMLLQDFLASARRHREHFFFFTEECSTLFAPPKIKYYRSNENHQYRKTRLSMIDFV